LEKTLIDGMKVSSVPRRPPWGPTTTSGATGSPPSSKRM
jgi:hypothetical protein